MVSLRPEPHRTATPDRTASRAARPARTPRAARGDRVVEARADRRGRPIQPRTTDVQALRSPTVLVVVLVALLGVLAYTIFLFNPANRGDLLPYSLVIVAEVVLITQVVLSMWTILSASSDVRDFRFHNAQDRLYDARAIIADGTEARPEAWPMRLADRAIAVDVFITVYGEDVEIVRRTVRAAVAMRGRHLTWVLDDGRSDEVRELAEQEGARYIRRLSSNGAKAGNINHALTLAGGDYFAVFDADFVPRPEFLYETVPFFSDENVAFVQTPQTYGNLRTSIARGAGYMQSVFYRLVQPGRNTFNAAFCVGTNVIFRREAIDEVGGIYTDSKSEDVWTSLMLHEHGWRSVYIPTTLAVGDAPETIEDYTKQQLRWATGGFEILLTHSPLSPRRRLTTDQRVQYFVTATHYLSGIVPLLLILVPPLEIFFGLRPVNLSVTAETWLMFYLGFYGMQIFLAFIIMGSFRPATLLLAAVSFPIYLRALVNVIEGRQQTWHVTGGRRRRNSPFNFIIPQTLFFVFLLLSSLVAIYKDLGNGALTLATAWNVTNTLILGAFMIVALQEARRIRRSNRGVAQAEREEAALAAVAAPSAPAHAAAPASAPTPVPVAASTPARRPASLQRSTS